MPEPAIVMKLAVACDFAVRGAPCIGDVHVAGALAMPVGATNRASAL